MHQLINFIAAIVFLIPYSLSAQWYSHSFDVMGTRAKVEFEWSNGKQAAQLIQQIIDEMNRIDRLMSPYKSDSELSLINRQAAVEPLTISREMFELLQKANLISEMTNGAFDISFSSVGYLYDYHNNQRPSQQQINLLKDAINYRRVKLNAKQSSVFFTDKRVKIDLGGIAKGHAVDRCIDILILAGIRNAYISAGGDSRLIGRKEGRLWYIGIRHPRDETKLLVKLPLENVALSTSGDYERFFYENGIRYHHIINPRTGESVTGVQSATILADNATMADALSTSIFVLGIEKGMALVDKLAGISAIMVDRHGKPFFSEGLLSAD